MCNGTLLSSEWVVARRWHRCTWCWFTAIESGELHEVQSIAAEGTVQRSRFHLWCMVQMQDMDHRDVCEITPGTNEPVVVKPFRRAKT